MEDKIGVDKIRKQYAFELNSLSEKGTFMIKPTYMQGIVGIRKKDNKPKYLLKIFIENHCAPKVYIISPKIRKKNGESPPHIYELHSKWNSKEQHYDTLRLCLYYPVNKEFVYGDMLMPTIISWAIKWTEFYELWLLTGEWFGGGIHHDAKGKEE